MTMQRPNWTHLRRNDLQSPRVYSAVDAERYFDHLEAENKKLREALEFYANQDNWEYADSQFQYSQYDKIKNDSFDSNIGEGGGIEYGGKRARAALKGE
jgi:hypothetical protein